MENSFYHETFEMIKNRKEQIGDAFEKECIRLLNSGAIDRESHNRGLLFGTALENISDNWLRGERKTKEYRNLKRF